MATPTLIQHVAGSCSANAGNTQAYTPYNLKLPNAVLNGNALIVCLQCPSGVSPTSVKASVNGASGLSLTSRANNDDTRQNLIIYSLHNITAGSNQIDVAFAANQTGVDFWVGEFNNLTTAGTLDGTNGNSGASGATLTPGSITTTVGSDLIIVCGIQDTSPSGVTSYTKGSGMTFLMNNYENGMAVEYQVQGSAGAINVGFTQSPTTNAWNCVQVAFQSATQGTTAPTTMYVKGVSHQTSDAGGLSGTQAIKEGFPCFGNLLVAMFISIDTFVSLTDPTNGTWSTASTLNNVNGGSGNGSMAYKQNATPSDTMELTFNVTGSGALGAGDVLLFDIANAPASAFDVAGSNTGTAAGLTAVGPSITPTTTNGIVLGSIGVTSNTVISVTASGSDGTPVFQSELVTPKASPSSVDNNNGWVLQYLTAKNATAFTYTNDIAAGAWEAQAIAFKGPTTVSYKSWDSVDQPEPMIPKVLMY